jgi:4-aminobutyrate aminotransferase / (S)-3-amino-2-methylpropionate transaminase / 5-aminovalerate transaminase
MAGKSFALVPKKVPAVRTKNRKIVTKIPVPESLPILKQLREYEPLSMTGQPLIVWDKAQGVHVQDKWGNKWLDWSSGVLVANAGHSHPAIIKAMRDQLNKKMIHNYCFPSEGRAKLAKMLVDITPANMKKAFIMTTGSEATECAIKLMRTWGQKVGGKKKIGIISFENGFHGRTLGSQMAGGMPALKHWIVNVDPDMNQVPFPDGYWNEDVSFNSFLKSLKKQGITPSQIAGVMYETYQGASAAFAPKAFMQELSKWAKKHNILVTCDEVQACFGRTGKFWAFEHYGIKPDLVCCGKGVSSSMPLSAIIGRKDVMDQYPPGSMTSTHTGNPLCAAAAIANIEVIKKEKLVENAAKVGKVMEKEFVKLQKKYPEVLGCIRGKGLVFALHIVKPGKKVADYDTAFEIVKACIEKGLLMFSPVGACSIKIAPPLCTTKEQALEGCSVLAEAFEQVLGK